MNDLYFCDLDLIEILLADDKNMIILAKNKSCCRSFTEGMTLNEAMSQQIIFSRMRRWGMGHCAQVRAYWSNIFKFYQAAI